MVENNCGGRRERNGDERRTRGRQEGERMCPPDIRSQHLVCYSEPLRQTERKTRLNYNGKNVDEVNAK